MTLGSARGTAGTGQMVPRSPGPLLYWVLVWALGRQEGVQDPAPPPQNRAHGGVGGAGHRGEQGRGGALTQERTEADLQKGKVRAMQVWGRGPG